MSSIWAVARNTIKQALRMKIAVVFTILLLVLLPVLGASATGDETIKGRLQTFISYGFSLTSFLLCILTISISVYTVTNDIKEKQIFTIITKPIRRIEFLVGKLLGVVLLNTILLTVFAVIIYSIAIYMPKYYKVSGEELEQVNKEFYTARASLPIPRKDFTKLANERYKELKEQDGIPEDMSRAEAINEIDKILQILSRSVDVGSAIEWEFENVKSLSDTFFIRFKYEIFKDEPELRIYNQWVVGDPYLVQTQEPGKTPVYAKNFRHLSDTFYEIEIPSDVIPESGKLLVRFYNYPSNNIVVSFPKDGLEVLFKAESFTSNFIKATILILCRIVFLSCLSIFASTFLSFPVAFFLCLILFVPASFSGFILSSFDYVNQNVGIFYSYTLEWMIKMLPEFDKYNPSKFLITSRLVSWSFLGQCIFFMVCIKSLLLLVLAFIVFSYREIAKIIV